MQRDTGLSHPGRMVRGAAVLTLALAAAAACAQETLRTTREATRQVCWLDRMCDPAQWSPVEECQALASDHPCPAGGGVLLLRFGIDHHGGEKAYPIGWPRAHFVPRGPEADWASWDAFEFVVQVRFEGHRQPASPISLEVGETKPAFMLPLKLPPGDAWTTITVPVAEILQGHPELARGVPRVRFVVSESNYRDRDLIEFHLGGFRLTRSLDCEVTAFRTTTPVVFAGQTFVKLEVTLSGPPDRVRDGIPFAVRRPGDPEPLRRERLPLQRGRQLYPCDLSGLGLAPGDYELVLFDEDPARSRAARLKVVPDPWTQP